MSATVSDVCVYGCALVEAAQFLALQLHRKARNGWHTKCHVTEVHVHLRNSICANLPEDMYALM